MEDSTPLVASMLNARPAKPVRSTRAVFVIAALATAAWSAQAALSDFAPAQAPSLAYLVGRVLGAGFFVTPLIALAVWLVLYFTVVRSRNPARGAPYLIALVVIAYVSNIAVPVGLYQLQSGPARSTRALTDEIAALDAAFQSDQAARSQAFQAALTDTHWNAVLRDGTSDPGQALKDIQAARELVLSHGAVTRQRQAERRARLSAILERRHVSPETMAMVMGNSDASDAMNHEAQTLSLRQIANAEALARLLVHARGRWRFENNAFVFDDQANLAAFNKIQASIREVELGMGGLRQRAAAMSSPPR